MDAAKFLELQSQMKQNNEEYMEFVKELDDWKVDLEKKQKRVEKGSESDMPPVRNSLFKKKLKKKPKPKEIEKQQQQQQSKRKIKAYDYAEWDKFNVEKACQQVDQQQSASSASEYETDEEWEDERRRLLAEEIKTKGNAAFKEGRYEVAVEEYTRCVQLLPDNATYYNNRAMAQIKLSKYAAAEQDCDSALQLDSKLLKALYRRGVARRELGKLTEALRDLEEALAAEPNNRSVRNEVLQLRQRLQQEQQQEELAAAGVGLVQPLFDKPQHLRSDLPLMRIQVQEVSTDKAAADAAASIVKVDDELQSKQPQQQQPRQQPQQQQQQSQPIPDKNITAFQFQTACRHLHRTPQQYHDYLLLVPVEKFSRLIGSMLDSQVLMQMIAAFVCGLAADPNCATAVVQRLICITEAQRFHVTSLMLSNNDRMIVKQLIHDAAQFGADGQLLEKLRIAFS